MNIKEIAEKFGITPDTIRYYEKIGIIPPIKRDKNGYRIFTKQDMNWIFLARSLRNAGVSIESLLEFGHYSEATGDARLHQKDILKNQLEHIDTNIAELQKTRELLAYKIDTFDEHLARFNYGPAISDDEVEELWERRFYQK